MAIPDYQSLMLPVLRAASQGEMRVGAFIERLADELRLSPEGRTEMFSSGKQTIFTNRVHWAKTYLSKAGLIEMTKRGHFVITPRGKKLLDEGVRTIDNKLLARFEEFRRFTGRTEEPGDALAFPDTAGVQDRKQTPDEIMGLAHREVEMALADELLSRVRSAPPDFFERLIVKLLLSMGYGGSTKDAGRAIGRSGDDGVDGVIDQDALGLDRVYIQAKRYAAGNTIGAGAIRDFFGSLDRHKAAKGLFVTSSTFTQSAVETAAMLSKRIVLVDGGQLAKLMIRHNVGCRVEDTLYLKKIDEEFFE